ncbi:uncharacterized protein PADG_11628 [Paracoccidioides brasiliensis Pb18]|uniref:Uncharacterized protein n=1 Tax=Paracoccidioides brasiliensis (strain Pb18) TaxID=502780 RepID=A0A0A0HUR9_PARBD|nr:uncharacterized protein PADG_11628 [Paracoccidioides brasiliensis Pb18]KGM92098.1 hypothetical protein PADG_11628 [Paracoccidioides brasiliensis Pb18]
MMLLSPASCRTELRALCIRREIKKQNKRCNNQKKKGWLQRVGPRVWHRVSKKMPLVETIKRKRHESLTARGPFQPILLPSDIEGIQAVTMPSTPEPPEEAYSYSDISGELSDSSSMREDMFHLDVLDLLEDLAAIDVGTDAITGNLDFDTWLSMFLYNTPSLYTSHNNKPRKQFIKLRMALIRNNAGLLQHQTLYVEGQQLAPLAFSSHGLMVPAPFLSAFGYPGTSGGHVRIASGAITELDAPYDMVMTLRGMTLAWTMTRPTSWSLLFLPSSLLPPASAPGHHPAPVLAFPRSSGAEEARDHLYGD